jgi:hypothetical protein
MAGKLFKWLFLFLAVPLLHGFIAGAKHPLFVSVTEIEHNAADKTIEISCKIFTDDFEKALRQQYKTTVDLLKPKDKTAMKKLVSDYVNKHLQFTVNGKTAALQFLDYEQQEEGIISYYQINNIPALTKLDITNNILYEYKKEQIGIIHVIVDGNRKSSRLDNPKDKVSFEF